MHVLYTEYHECVTSRHAMQCADLFQSPSFGATGAAKVGTGTGGAACGFSGLALLWVAASQCGNIMSTIYIFQNKQWKSNYIYCTHIQPEPDP